MISQLCAEHRTLEVHAALLLRIVAVPAPDAAAVAAMRWRMMQALLDHCRQEDALVYDRLLASGDPIAAEVARRYRAEHGALGAAFARYIAAWPVARIAREWGRFRAETQAILADLAARVASEEDDLYPHAQRVLAERTPA